MPPDLAPVPSQTASVEVPQHLPGADPAADSVRELMGRPPHWLLRAGATYLGVAILVLLTLGAFISYPDTITSRVTVIGSNAVVEVMARQSGHLQSLRVQEKQIVKMGDVLAVIQSPCDADTVFRVKESLAILQPMFSDETPFVEAKFLPEPKLGKLQDSYAQFLASYSRLRTLWLDEHTTENVEMLKAQTERKREQLEAMRKQQTAMDRELKLAQEKFNRMTVLHKRASISTLQMQEAEAAFLSQQREQSGLRKNLLEEEILASRLDKEISDLQHDRIEALQAGRETLRQALQKLRGEIDVWEADFVLRAPARGMVAFYDFWSDQQYVTANKQVFLIVPETSRLVGRMTLSQGGTGKIQPGQQVRIKFDDYPSREFGYCMGKVQKVSLVARDGSNLALIDLDYPLVSTYKKPLHFTQEMAGEASIITEKSSLLGQIFREIRKAFDQNGG